jgi:hypothetical protein
MQRGDNAMTSQRELLCRTAFGQIADGVDIRRLLPDQVFIGAWEQFRFVPTGNIFAPTFVAIVGELLRAEGAQACCLANIGRMPSLKYEAGAVLCIDESVSGAQYMAALQGDGPATGWLFQMDRYACASEMGGWCLYCEKENDVGVVGLRSGAGERFAAALHGLGARRIESLLNDKATSPPPFNRLVPEWERGLREHYGD